MKSSWSWFWLCARILVAGILLTSNLVHLHARCHIHKHHDTRKIWHHIWLTSLFIKPNATFYDWRVNCNIQISRTSLFFPVQTKKNVTSINQTTKRSYIRSSTINKYEQTNPNLSTKMNNTTNYFRKSTQASSCDSCPSARAQLINSWRARAREKTIIFNQIPTFLHWENSASCSDAFVRLAIFFSTRDWPCSCHCIIKVFSLRMLSEKWTFGRITW